MFSATGVLWILSMRMLQRVNVLRVLLFEWTLRLSKRRAVLECLCVGFQPGFVRVVSVLRLGIPLRANPVHLSRLDRWLLLDLAASLVPLVETILPEAHPVPEPMPCALLDRSVGGAS